MNKNFGIDNYSYFNKYIEKEKVNEILEVIKNIIKEKKLNSTSEFSFVLNINYFKNLKLFVHNMLKNVLINIYDIYYLNKDFKIHLNNLPKKNKKKDIIQVFLSLTDSITRGSYIYFNKNIFDNNLINIKLNMGDILIFNYNILFGGFNSVMSKPNILLEFEVSNKEFRRI